MVSEARQLLSDDHHEVGEVLKQLLTALDNKDVAATYSRLDLLWARLAVHIRAEHLHLFPAVASKHSEAESVIEKLREDHNFFMRELAQAIGILRELPQAPNTEARLTAILDTVREIEKRLTIHNKLEEDQIYRWAKTILTEPEQLDLATHIQHELENRPLRFSEQAWVNQ
jgi:hemerythrin superfamily protein